MKYLMVLLAALLIPTAAFAGGECKADRQKFCKDVIEAKGDVGACLGQHASELSAACKTKYEEKKKTEGGSAKTGKEEGTNTEPNQATVPETETKKIDQPEAH